MLVPGLSTVGKLKIQSKLDKLLRKEYNTPCSKFMKHINSFNEQVTKNFSEEKMSKLNAKLSKNFYLKRSPEAKLNQIINIDTNVSAFEHVKNELFKTFNINELLILFNNLDYFIKDENIRAVFPKINKNNYETIYAKDISDNSPLKKIKKQLNIISPLKYDKSLNVLNSSHLINKDKINNILLNYKKRLKKEEEKIYNQKIKNINTQRQFQKTMKKLRYNLNNISKLSNSKEYTYEHPLANYYIEKRKDIQNTNIINYKKNIVLSANNKTNYKNKIVLNKNKNTLSILKNIEDNLLSTRLKEKNEKFKRLKKIASLTKRYSNTFRRKLFTLRQQNSSHNLENNNNCKKIDLIKDFNSFNSYN